MARSKIRNRSCCTCTNRAHVGLHTPPNHSMADPAGRAAHTGVRDIERVPQRRRVAPPSRPSSCSPLAARLLCLSGRPRAASPCHHRPGRPEAGCRRGPQRTDRPCLRVRVHVWQLNACVSKRHELSVREHERWRGECRRAGAPYSIELVEPSTCEFGSRTGDPPALHRAELCEDSKQQTGTAK